MESARFFLLKIKGKIKESTNTENSLDSFWDQQKRLHSIWYVPAVSPTDDMAC